MTWPPGTGGLYFYFYPPCGYIDSINCIPFSLSTEICNNQLCENRLPIVCLSLWPHKFVKTPDLPLLLPFHLHIHLFTLVLEQENIYITHTHNLHTCACTGKHTHIHIQAHQCPHRHTHTHTPVPTQANTYTYTHIHIFPHMWPFHFHHSPAVWGIYDVFSKVIVKCLMTSQVPANCHRKYGC